MVGSEDVRGKEKENETLRGCAIWLILPGRKLVAIVECIGCMQGPKGSFGTANCFRAESPDINQVGVVKIEMKIFPISPAEKKE